MEWKFDYQGDVTTVKNLFLADPNIPVPIKKCLLAMVSNHPAGDAYPIRVLGEGDDWQIDTLSLVEFSP